MQEFFANMMKREKADKVARYKRLNKFVKKGAVLFAGSSLMEQYPVCELLVDAGIPLTAYNRGIGGFVCSELVDALEECVLELEPRHIFLNIGTNDLNQPECDDAELVRRLEDIIARIRTRLPEVSITFMAYYPINADAAPEHMKRALEVRSNERIHAANAAVKAMCERLGIEWADYNRGLFDEQGRQKAEYTIDGMHFYADGYMQVFDEMRDRLTALAMEECE